MSEQQIEQIIKRLDKQDEVLRSIQAKVDPVYAIFQNVEGFGNITVNLLKGLGLLGLSIGVVYAFINWIRN